MCLKNEEIDGMKTVYIAGPLFTEGERYFLGNIEKICSKMGFKTYLPHRIYFSRRKNSKCKTTN